MSRAVRWILAILVFLLGIAAASFSILGGAFATVGCTKVPPDWVYYVLIVVGVLILAATATTSVLLIRKARTVAVVVFAALGPTLLCIGLTGYFVLLGQYC